MIFLNARYFSYILANLTAAFVFEHRLESKWIPTPNYRALIFQFLPFKDRLCPASSNARF